MGVNCCCSKDKPSLILIAEQRNEELIREAIKRNTNMELMQMKITAKEYARAVRKHNEGGRWNNIPEYHYMGVLKQHNSTICLPFKLRKASASVYNPSTK
jgi:hypothetical protein